MEKRVEHDLLGEMEIPVDACWGIHTARAKKNFFPSGTPVHKDLILALVMVKKACAQTNLSLEFLSKNQARAIDYACDRLLNSDISFLNSQFPLDALQGGAGTSTNMNVNEVITNLALEKMGHKKGDYAFLHPIEHVNMHQSTNDVYPTALKIAVIFSLRRLSEAIAAVQGVFQKKEKAFASALKIGRTEMEEAVPMTMGMEFSAFSEAWSRDRWRTFKCEERIRVVNIGGTAVGTGITAPREYIFGAIESLRSITGLGLARAENMVDQTANADSFVEVSGMLKAHAVNIMKICRDLRLLHMQGQISLERVQAGSSIMPGKVNPVILESVIQSSVKVISNDFIITECASSGTLQINEFMPLIASATLESLDILMNINMMLKSHVAEIEINEKVCSEQFNKSEAIVTALVPDIGYERATSLLEEYRGSGSTNIRDFLTLRLGPETVDHALSPNRVTALGYRR